MRINHKKNETMGHGEAHPVPFLMQNEGLTVENAGLNPSSRVVLNAAMYTAAEGVNERNSTETPTAPIRCNPLKVKHLTAINGTERNHTETSQIHKPDGEGFEPPVRCRTPIFKTGPFDHSGIHPQPLYAVFTQPYRF